MLNAGFKPLHNIEQRHGTILGWDRPFRSLDISMSLTRMLRMSVNPHSTRPTQPAIRKVSASGGVKSHPVNLQVTNHENCVFLSSYFAETTHLTKPT